MTFVVWPGHADPELARRYYEGNARRRSELGGRLGFGRPDLPKCGVTTRAGTSCRCLRVRGFERCYTHLRLADRKKLNARREDLFRRGKLSPAKRRLLLERRSRTTLAAAWQRDPWIPGATIDLVDFEPEFRQAMAYAGFAVDDLPPALADKSRWKWRRVQLDGQPDDAWRTFLSFDLPKRVVKAGERPADTDSRRPPMMPVPLVVKAPGPYSKRRRPSPTPLRKVTPMKPVANVATDDDMVSELFPRYAAELRAPLAMCEGPKDERAVLTAFLALMRDPGSADALRCWHGVLRTLSDR